MEVINLKICLLEIGYQITMILLFLKRTEDVRHRLLTMHPGGKVQIIIYLKKMGRWCLAAVKDMQEELMIKRRQQKRQGIIVVSII